MPERSTSPSHEHAHQTAGGTNLRGRSPVRRGWHFAALQASVGNRVLSRAIQQVLNDTGQPLDTSTRTYMESRFLHDFTDVRVHDDGRAAETAKKVNAVAYTVGRHVAFSADAYRPNTTAGRHLLAHELAHVVQQSRGDGSPPSLDPNSALEQGAESAAESIGSAAGSVEVTGGSAPGLARQVPGGKGAASAASHGASETRQVAAALGEMAKEAAETAVESRLIDEILAATTTQASNTVVLSGPLQQIAAATGTEARLTFTLEELADETTRQVKEAALVEEMLEAAKRSRQETGKRILEEILADPAQQQKLAQHVAATVERNAERTALNRVVNEMAQSTAALPATAPAVAQALQQSTRPARTPLDIPAEGIDMPWVGKGAGVTASELGYLRDSRFYWTEYQSRWPQHLSPDNVRLIESGRAPTVDDTWLTYHREHAAYRGQVLEHHHLGQGSRAVPLPEKLHDAYTVFHPQRQVVGEGAKPLKPLKPLPTAARTQSETQRHIRRGRIAGAGITPGTVPPAHAVPRASALAGVPERELRPVRPDTGIDPRTGRAVPAPAATPTATPSAPAPSAQTSPAPTPSARVSEPPAATSVTPTSSAPTVSPGETAGRRAESASEQAALQELEKRSERAVAEALEHRGVVQTQRLAEKEATERAIKSLETTAVAEVAGRRSASFAPVVGWYFAEQDVEKGVQDIIHGNIALGAVTIAVAGVDVLSDALHLTDVVTGGGGTVLSLTIQAWTSAMQVGAEAARVGERANELNAYVKKHGALPPDKDLTEYYRLNDEDIAMLKAPGRRPHQSAAQIRDQIRKLISDLEDGVHQKPLGSDDMEKLQTERRILASLLATFEERAKTEEQQATQAAKRKKQANFAAWQKRKEAEERSRPTPQTPKGPPSLLPREAESEPAPLLPGMPPESPLKKSAGVVQDFEFETIQLVDRGTALADRIHSSKPPSSEEREAFRESEKKWRAFVTSPPDRVRKLPGGVEAKLRELLDRYGPKLQTIRTLLVG